HSWSRSRPRMALPLGTGMAATFVQLTGSRRAVENRGAVCRAEISSGGMAVTPTPRPAGRGPSRAGLRKSLPVPSHLARRDLHVLDVAVYLGKRRASTRRSPGGDGATMTLSRRFTEALEWAADVHRGDVRKGTSIPYIGHPLAVASIVLEQAG